MNESTFEMFAQLRADQVINDIISDKDWIGAPVDPVNLKRRFQDYYDDVEELPETNPPISPSAIFFEACLDKSRFYLDVAKQMLANSGITAVPARLACLLERQDQLDADTEYNAGYAHYINHMLDAISVQDEVFHMKAAERDRLRLQSAATS